MNSTNNIKWYITILILLLIIFFQCFKYSGNRSDFENEIEKLHKQNDSLFCNIDLNVLKIKQLDSAINIFKFKIEQDKLRLDSLKIISDKNKQKYDKEHNRINSLSNSAVAREFADTFN